MTGRTGGLSSNGTLLDKLQVTGWQVTGFGDLNIWVSTCNLLICKRIEKVVFSSSLWPVFCCKYLLMLTVMACAG